MPTNQRVGEFVLSIDETRPVSLERRRGRTRFAKLLALADEPANFRLDGLHVEHILPQRDAHRERYRHPSRPY